MEISAGFVAYAHTGIDEVQRLWAKDPMRVYNRIGKITNDIQEYHRVGSISDFPVAAALDRGQAIPEVQFSRPFMKDYTAKYYSLKWVAEKIALKNDPYKTLAEGQEALMDSIYRALDVEACGIINLATSTVTANLGLDGVAFASASHPYAGGVWSNILSANPVLSQAALEAAFVALRKQPSYNGGYMTFPQKFVLYVPEELYPVARRMVMAAGYMGTTTTGAPKAEGPNLMNEDKVRIVSSPFMTSTTAWAVGIDDARFTKYGILMRQSPETNTWAENNYNALAHSVTSYFTAMRGDARGFVYSSGAGS